MDFFGLTFIMFIGAAGALLGFLILLFTAFTTSAAWGFGSLLVPPVVLAFAVSHWSKAKKGFTILMVGVIIFAYGNWDKNQVAKNQVAGQAVDQAIDQPVQELIAPANDGAPDTPKSPSQQTASPLVSSSPTPSATAPVNQASGADNGKPRVINIIDAHKYINREVRVTTDSGKVRIGTLLEVNDSGIVIDYVVQGATGRVKTAISEDQIHLIELLP